MANQDLSNNQNYNQQQGVGDIKVHGNENILNVIQGKVVNLSIYDPIPSGLMSQLTVKTQKTLSKKEYRQRQVLLNKVREFWIEGVLETSLHARVLIELQIYKRSDAIQPPFYGVREFSEIETQPLPTEANVSTVFKQMGEGRTLLILGKPGSGKTITLLKLAQDLILNAKEDLNRPLPVVFNLSSWGSKRQSIDQWLIQELYEKYQVSKTLGKIWIEEQQLILLLDGLDEVKSEYRDACVQALNQFIQANGLTEIVISCRIQDYQALANKLRLRGAISIQPLTPGQIEHYLDSADNHLSALKQALQQNKLLKLLATSPLMLSIMSLTYQGHSLKDFPQPTTAAESYQQLFDAYIDRMFQRRGTFNCYSRHQTQKWLVWLAQQMSYASQSIFFIEGIQRSWLPDRVLKNIHTLICALSGGLCGFITIKIFIWMSRWLSQEFSNDLYLLVSGLLIGIFIGVVRDAKSEIKTVETLQWPWQASKQNYRNKIFFGVGLSLILSLVSILSFCFKSALVYGGIPLFLALLTGVLINELIDKLIGFLRGPEIQQKSYPNQGIYRSMRNAIILGLTLGLISGLVCKLTSGAAMGLISGSWIGICAGMGGGARAVGLHLNLRFILYCAGYTPLNYSHFLDYASDHLFLQQVGGGYIFVHRALLEHFAQMKLGQEPE